MKRWIALFLALIAVFSLTACDTTENNNEPAVLVIEEKFDEYGNILIEPLYMGWNLWYYNSYTYDADQKLVNVTRYTYNDLYLDEQRYFYRADGTLEKVEFYWENVHSEILLWKVESYNESGLLVKSQSFEDGAVYDTYTYEYADGKLVKELYYWAENNSEDSYKDYFYDDAGNCIRVDEYDAWNLAFYYTYSYDANGNVARENKIQVLEDGEITTYIEYTYHDNGRVKDVIDVGYEMRLDQTWDERGSLVLEKRYVPDESGEWFLKVKTEYDGNMKTYTTYHRDGRYNTETMKGSAEVTHWSERAYYNADGTLFCTNSNGVFYDPDGNRMEPTIGMLDPWEEYN